MIAIMSKNKKLKIAFISPKRYSFYPGDYLERGLGGTESMLVLLSSALAKLGHAVEVFNCCYIPGVYKGVHWKPVHTFKNSEQYDVCVSVRLLETFDVFEIRSPIRAIWIHDDSLRGATESDKSGKINLWIAVSNTQKRFIERTEQISGKNWFVTRNAYDEELYARKVPKVRGQVVYCSAPDRGLEYLLKYWGEIKRRVPFANLHVTGSFALWGNADEENNRFFEKLYKLESSLKDVHFHKRLKKGELAKLQSESELMLYPTTFDEMYCISALECMSVGTPVVSTARAAMLERISSGHNGLLIEGHPKDEDYRSEFISSTVKLMESSELLNQLAINAINDTIELDFLNLAKEWESKFSARLHS